MKTFCLYMDCRSCGLDVDVSAPPILRNSIGNLLVVSGGLTGQEAESIMACRWISGYGKQGCNDFCVIAFGENWCIAASYMPFRWSCH